MRISKKPLFNEPIYIKQILYITGKEKTAFNYWPLLRKTLRPIHQYTLCKKIEAAIVKPSLWDKPEKIKLILSKYFILKKSKENL
jgi:hypothetical protein